MDRREFVRTTASLSVAAGIGGGLRAVEGASLRAPRRLRRIGLELYSVRNEMSRDPERTLAAVAKIGYQDVELLWSWGNFGRSAAQVRSALDNTGLAAPSAHMSAATILVGWERSLEIAERLGHRYLVVASFTSETERTLDDWKEWADRFNEAGAIAKAAGIGLAMHNEPKYTRRIDGQVPYDVFIERTSPSVVSLQLDIGNMVMGGADPLLYLQRYPQRFTSFHVKDVVADGSGDTGLGQGRVPLGRLLAAMLDVENKPCYVEEEDAKDPLASVARDYSYLRALEF